MVIGPDGAAQPERLPWWRRWFDPEARHAYRNFTTAKSQDDLVLVDKLPLDFNLVMPPELIPRWEALAEAERAEIMAAMSEQIIEARLHGDLPEPTPDPPSGEVSGT